MANDMYNTYDNEYVAYSYNYSIRNSGAPNETFYYGDTINFEIALFNDISIENDSQTQLFSVAIKNFRNEIVYEKECTCEDYLVNININANEARTKLKRGLYICEVKLIDTNIIKTVLDDYLIRIK